MNNLFTPLANTVNIAGTTSTANVALGAVGKTIRVKNLDATNAAFINFGDSTITATTAAGIPIGPGEVAGFTRGPGVTHAAAITASSTATVYFTPGEGV